MTTNEMMQRYVERYGLHYVKGDSDDIAPLMPYFLMDIGYQYYCKDILPLALRFDIQKARTFWRDSYNDFNDTLWNVFPDTDEQCEVTDIIDSLHASMANDLTVAQVSAMNCFDSLTFEQQKVLSSCLMTNMLAVKAESYWEMIFRRRNRHIEGVLHGTEQFAKHYLKNLGEYDSVTEDKNAETLLKSSEILNSRIIEWYKKHN